MGKPGRPLMLRGIGAYLVKAIRFHDVKSNYIAPLVFIILLIVNFIYVVISMNFPVDELYAATNVPTGDISMESIMDSIRKLEPVLSKVLFARFAGELLITVVSSFYLLAFLKQLRGEVLTFTLAVKGTLSKLASVALWALILKVPFLISAALLRIPGMFLYLAIAVFILFVPGIILYMMFIFSPNLLLDKRMGLLQSFRSSYALTKGHRVEIFSIVLIFSFVSTVAADFADSMAASFNNSLVMMFVHAFFITIFNLVKLRAAALMYTDLQYGWKPAARA